VTYNNAWFFATQRAFTHISTDLSFIVSFRVEVSAFAHTQWSVSMRSLCVLAMFLVPSMVVAQEGPKPGPEHEILKKHVGEWSFTMKFGGMETKGTSSYKMDLGGLWLASSLECELFGAKFQGRGMDTYDAAKKKYIGIWVDSMGTQPLVMEGDYDAAKKSLTLVGTGPGMDGKPTTFKSVSLMPDDDTIEFTMYIGETKEPAFTVSYKRKK
jgi:hypothetical protein